jgi:hypothetical protein
MNKIFRKVSLVLAATLLFGTAHADEGMWLPIYIQKLQSKIKPMGCKLTADDIYNVNKASIKDAIVSFGGFCTGEIVSSKGLVFTNHHCGYDAIAELSSVKDNYLKDGFWAMSHDKEIPVKGLTVKILVKMEDVTSLVKGKENQDAIIDSLVALNEKTPGYKAEVESYFYNNEYYLLVYEIFKDIRLVGTPPESVGKFGGDTDNWMWPRHTGDFSIFRIYAGQDNKPADYSPNNKPYTPKKYLPISLKGVKENDFSFIMGFPGRTQRYLTSDGIKKTVFTEYPMASAIMDRKLKTQKSFMDKDEKIKLQLAGDYASLANYWKYMLGNIFAAKNSDFLLRKEKFEKEFQTWADADPKRKEQYGNLIADLKKTYESDPAASKLENYLNFCYFGPAFVSYGSRMFQLSMGGVSSDRAKESIEKLKKGLDKHFKDYNATVDKAVLTEMIRMAMHDLPQDNWPAILKSEKFNQLSGKNNEEKAAAYAEDVFSKSMLTDRAKMEAWLNAPDAKALVADAGFEFVKDCITLYMSNMNSSQGAAMAEEELMEKYVKAMREFQPERFFYPDANSTLRFTYGKVLPYVPKDAVFFNYFTTAKGILEKEVPGDLEFDVPKKLHDLIVSKDYGRYGKDGVLNTCFLSDNDITGGNSGSPVINGQGHLIGIAFDGNWESMVGDLSFQPSVQRTISVDIRYVLFFIDKYAGANNLISELEIIE